MKGFFWACVLSGIMAMPLRGQIMSGMHLNGGIAVGRLSDYGGGGVGVGGQAKFFVIERLSLGFNAGWMYFFGQQYNFSFIPVRGTAEYFFRDEGARIRPYAGTDLGMYITSYTGNTRILFGVAPGGGVLFELSDYVNLSVGAKYNLLVDNGVTMYVEPKVSFLYVFGMY